MEAQKELERRRKELQRQEHEINEELKKSQVVNIIIIIKVTIINLLLDGRTTFKKIK
jgi:hypothetical protein